jgi:hypothetical protein
VRELGELVAAALSTDATSFGASASPAHESITTRAPSHRAADETWLGKPGDIGVDTSTICVLTRFGLRSPLHVLPTYRDYRRVLRQAHDSGTPGLLKSAFLLETAKACYSLSLWAELAAIPRFGTNVPVHVAAGNGVFSRLSRTPTHGAPELWSTKWRLAGVTRVWETDR